MKKFNYKFALKILLRKLNMLTVAEAQWLFRLYLSERTEFCLRGTSGKLYGSSAATLSIDWTWIKGRDFASGIPTRFEGGPPLCRAYYNGTLVTFLVDRIMLCHLRRGTPLAWLVRFDPTSTRAIWDQLAASIPENMRAYSIHPKTKVAPTQRTLFDLDNPVVEVVKIGSYEVPIHENGVQGCVMPREGYTHPHSVGYDQSRNLTDGLCSWSGAGQTGLYA
jgi:hypothetical protein